MKLACPSAASAAISAATPSPSPASTGCRNQSTAASAAASAISRATASVIVWPSSANVMLATVVMPPAKAASEPLQKSSTQIGSSGNAFTSAGVIR